MMEPSIKEVSNQSPAQVNEMELFQELIPHMSCVCGPNDLEAALNKGYKQIYIYSRTQGMFKHHVLRGENRYVRVQVDSIPNWTPPKDPDETKITQSMNFLPAGKVPYILFEQILAFFKKVMEVQKNEVEAMIHILYNPEKGYHLGVPPQTVSKASVSYDWNYIPDGSSIVVDVHSHNTMGR